MDEKRLVIMNIVSNLLSSYYGNKTCFCIVNNREPDDAEKDQLLTRVISMFENLATSYQADIENIAEGSE
jgi:hypothetical protein